MEMKTFLKKSLELAIASRSVLLISLAVSIFSLLQTRSSIFTLFLFGYSLGWMGTKIALVKDIYVNHKANWNKTGIYFRKYFVRFLPLVLIYILGFIFVILVAVIFYGIYKNAHPNSTTKMASQDISNFFKSFRTLNFNNPGVIGFIIGSLLSPFFGLFTPLIVIKDISFFKGIKRTISYNRQNLFLYKMLLLIHVLYQVSFLVIARNQSVLPIGLSFSTQSILLILNPFVDIFTISMIVVYTQDIEPK